MCTYNGARFLREQLDSLLAQTYSPIEIVITDDGSTDETAEIIASYTSKHANISFYRNETNLGFVKNFEKAISLCSGEYIALADQDDIWKPRKIERFIEEIGEHLLIYSDAELIDADALSLGRFLIRPEKKLVKGSCGLAFLFDNCVSGNTLLFRKTLASRILPIPQGVAFHDVWIAFAASSLGMITYTDEAMTLYRRYDTQVTHVSKKKAKGFRARLKEKRERKIASAQKVYDHLRACLQVENSSENRMVLEAVAGHYGAYAQHFYSFRLLRKIWPYRHQLFAMEPNAKARILKALKAPIGLRLYEATLYAI